MDKVDVMIVLDEAWKECEGSEKEVVLALVDETMVIVWSYEHTDTFIKVKTFEGDYYIPYESIEYVFTE